MGVLTHWIIVGNIGTGGYWGIYHPPLEHGCAIHCDPSYYGLVFGSRAEVGNVLIQAMVGTSRPEYHGDKYMAGSCGGGGGGAEVEEEGE